jgi:hypothetical protein
MDSSEEEEGIYQFQLYFMWTNEKPQASNEINLDSLQHYI